MNKIGQMILEELNLKECEPFYFRNQKFIFRDVNNKLKLFTYSNFGIIEDPKNLSDVLNNGADIVRGEYPCLLEKEKEYLANIIAPFASRTIYIRREDNLNIDVEKNTSRMVICYDDIISGACNIYLPHIPDTYMGLKPDVNYTPEELGLVSEVKENERKRD